MPYLCYTLPMPREKSQVTIKAGEAAPKTFKKYGHVFTRLKYTANKAALYRRQSTESDWHQHEVWRMRVIKGRGEKRPGAGDWGQRGWTYSANRKELAESHYSALTGAES